MNTFKKVYSTMAKAGLLMPLLVPAAIADLLPRDLDDDPATVEAYYDDQLDITAICGFSCYSLLRRLRGVVEVLIPVLSWKTT